MLCAAGLIICEQLLEMAVYDGNGIERQSVLLQPVFDRIHRYWISGKGPEVLLLDDRELFEHCGVSNEIVP